MLSFRLALLSRIRVLPLIALLVAAPTFALDAAQIYKHASESVVLVLALDEDNDPISSGSGFFIGDGKVIVTNWHVIENAASIRVKLANGKIFEIPVLEIDRASDLALLGYPHTGEPLALSGRSPEVGEEIVVIGNPEGLERSLSTGIISGIREDEGRVVYQITAPVSSGSSGSPVLDERGNVLGIATFILEEGQNLNFAYSAIHVQNLLGGFRSDTHPQARPLKGDLPWYATFAEKGDSYSQYELGRWYKSNEDYVEAMKWWHHAAEQGDPGAQYELGRIYAIGEVVPEDSSESLKWYLLSAEQDYVEAQNVLIIWAYFVKKDAKEHDKWLQRRNKVRSDGNSFFKRLLRSAAQGSPYAQFRVGEAYLKAWYDEAQDLEKSVQWYRLAATQGVIKAQSMLGSMYAEGTGVHKDHWEATRWWHQAAEQGDVDSQFNLGWAYTQGEGVPQNDAEAAKWYRRAAEQGDATAQHNLGVSYLKGKGVPENRAEAYIWYSIAVANGYEDAEETRDTIAKVLPDAVLYTAQQEAERRNREIQTSTQ